MPARPFMELNQNVNWRRRQAAETVMTIYKATRLRSAILNKARNISSTSICLLQSVIISLEINDFQNLLLRAAPRSCVILNLALIISQPFWALGDAPPPQLTDRASGLHFVNWYFPLREALGLSANVLITM